MINSELIENEKEFSSFLKLERRTSLVYKELLSRGIYASSAYKLPESLKRIYEKTRSISSFNSEQERGETWRGLESTSRKLCESAVSDENSTHSPLLRKRAHIIEVLSRCKQSFASKLLSEKIEEKEPEAEAEGDLICEGQLGNVSFDGKKRLERKLNFDSSNLKSITQFNNNFIIREQNDIISPDRDNRNDQHERKEQLKKFEFSPEEDFERNNDENSFKINLENLPSIKGSDSILNIKKCESKNEKLVFPNLKITPPSIFQNLNEKRDIKTKSFNTPDSLCNSHNRFINNSVSVSKIEIEIEEKIDCRESINNNLDQFKQQGQDLGNDVHKIFYRSINNNHTQPDEKFCRICKEDTETSDNTLISPCECEGMIKYTHSRCILQFLKEFEIFKKEKKNCEICHQKFKYDTIKYKKCKFLLFSNFKRLMVFLSFFVPLTIFFFSFLVKNLIEWEYDFLEIMANVLSGIFIICVLYIFRDILKFRYYENWMLGDTNNNDRLKNIHGVLVLGDQTDKSNLIESKGISYKAKSHSQKKKMSILNIDFQPISTNNIFYSPSKFSGLKRSLKKIKDIFLSLSGGGNTKDNNNHDLNQISKFENLQEEENTGNNPHSITNRNNISLFEEMKKESHREIRINTMPVGRIKGEEGDSPTIIEMRSLNTNANIDTTANRNNLFFLQDKEVKPIKFKSNIYKQKS